MKVFFLALVFVFCCNNNTSEYTADNTIAKVNVALSQNIPEPTSTPSNAI